MLTLLVTCQTLLAATLGVAIGGAAGLVVLRQLTSRTVAPSYPVAIAGLTLLASAVAAIVPASIAAWRDPLRVLRTP
jgi:putative ABC transport system permease protein